MVLWMYKRTSTHKHKNTNKHTHSLSLIHYGGFSFDRPMLEMTIPSVLDPTLAPPGAHVVSFFTQFTPYYLEGKEWTDQDKEAYADLGKNFLKPSKTAWVTFSQTVFSCS